MTEQISVNNSSASLPKPLMTIIALTLLVLFLFTQTLYVTIETDNYYHGKNIWKDWTYEPMDICERKRMENFIREPSNAYSDFTYLLLGLILIAMGIYDIYHTEVTENSSNIIKYPSITIVYGIHNIFHAAGSFFFHSCTCQELGRYDAGMMFGVTSFPIFYVVYHYFDKFEFGTREQSTHRIYLFFHVLMGIFFVATKDLFLSVEIQMVLIVLMDFLSIGIFFYFNSNAVDVKNLVFCIGTLIIGIGFWLLDIFQIWCFPDSPIQYHAIWHFDRRKKIKQTILSTETLMIGFKQSLQMPF
eukprot:gene9746-2073_t